MTFSKKSRTLEVIGQRKKRQNSCMSSALIGYFHLLIDNSLNIYSLLFILENLPFS